MSDISTRASHSAGKEANISPDALGIRKKAGFLFVLTLVYLLFELAFNARLLDVIGTTVDEEQIDHIEMWGRVISGCALTLGIWSLIISSDKPLQFSLLPMFITAGACLGASFLIQEGILRMISNNTTAAQKRAAASLVMIVRSIHSHDVTLKGMEQNSIDWESPEARTFLAIFPAMAIHVNHLEEKTKREIYQLARRQTIDDMGGFNYIFNEIYLESEVGIKQGFNDYVDGVRKYNTAISRNPGLEKQADSTYNREMEWNFNGVLPRNLNYSRFVAHSLVQKKWRNTISMKPDIILATDLSPEQFRRLVFEPWVDNVAAEKVEEILAPVDSFEKGEVNYQLGNTAIRITFVPLVAFAFSIFGALFHIMKTAWLASRTLNASRFFQITVCVVTLGACCGYFIPSLVASNSITESVLFNKLEADVNMKTNRITAQTIRYLVQFQTGFYPIANDIRLNVLQGFDFGIESNS